MKIEKKDKKRFVRYLPYIMEMLVMVFGFAGCASQQQGQEEQQEIHVAVSGSDEAGTGTQDATYATSMVRLNWDRNVPAVRTRLPSFVLQKAIKS